MKDLQQILDGEMPPLEKIEGIMNYLLGEKVYTHQKSAQIYNLLFVEKPEGLESTLSQVEGWFATLFEKHKKVLEEGVSSGIIRADLDTDFEPRAFYNFIWGYFTNSERFFTGFNEKALKEYIQRNFINTIAAAKKGRR